MVGDGRNKWVLINAFVIGLIFFFYYSFTGYHLPESAGPDYPASQKAVGFYLEHGRMAVIPEDEAKLTFTKYGNSRVVRPPLAFAGSAILANISPYLEADWTFAYRHASAAFLALTLSFIFIALSMLFSQSSLAFLGVLLVGLMPQYAFTASYLNDDSAAIFASTLMVLAMVWIKQCGISFIRLALLGLAVGLALIAKKTAWLMMPFVAVFYFLFIFNRQRSFIKDNLTLLLFFIIGGGWWLLFNMYHYGWQDPFAFNMLSELTSRHSNVDLSKYGFKAEGLNMKGLVLLNYKNFIGASFMAVVGHLDWLRLRVGNLQYGFYLVVVLLIAYYFIHHFVCWVCSFFKSDILTSNIKNIFLNKHIQFTWVLLAIVMFQLFMYVYHNVYNDIQIQGKYILPVILPLLIFALSGLKLMLDGLSEIIHKKHSQKVIGFFVVLTIWVHIDALISYVIPFYWP